MARRGRHRGKARETLFGTERRAGGVTEAWRARPHAEASEAPMVPPRYNATNQRHHGNLGGATSIGAIGAPRFEARHTQKRENFPEADRPNVPERRGGVLHAVRATRVRKAGVAEGKGEAPVEAAVEAAAEARLRRGVAARNSELPTPGEPPQRERVAPAHCEIVALLGALRGVHPEGRGPSPRSRCWRRPNKPWCGGFAPSGHSADTPPHHGQARLISDAPSSAEGGCRSNTPTRIL